MPIAESDTPDEEVSRASHIGQVNDARPKQIRDHSVTQGKKRARDGTVKQADATKITTGLKSAFKNLQPIPKAALVRSRSTERLSGQSKTGLSDGERALPRAKNSRLLEQRQKLPIWKHSDDIKRSLRGSRDVLLLVGETGSGKSTQVPQFLSSESWARHGMIAITQPRRVAAISLARRVAEEMETPLGKSSPASQVGYSVRFDQSVSPKTRIKFLTEGMLLQEMLRDPNLSQYSCVVVDEVHERSVNVDLILGFLRNLTTGSDGRRRKGKPLKVVIMSATADVEALSRFFEAKLENTDSNDRIDSSLSTPIANATQVPSINTQQGPSEGSRKFITDGTSENILNSKGKVDKNNRLSKLFIEGRQYPVQLIHLPEPTQDFVEEALKAVFHIHTKEPLPGDILVFLTGQDTVESLERLINEYAENMDPALPKILTLPLFAALPQTAQQRVFLPAPPRTRKVIISTNIAETSVTVPGVRHVVDSGKMKVKKYRANLGLESLLVEPVSRSSAIQRQGRAGREAPGKCYRLYTEKAYTDLEGVTLPEILRCDLSQAILTMKARGISDVINFPLLDPPPRAALEKALLRLLSLGALNDQGEISKIGQQISRMPLSPTLGRVLIEAAKAANDCVSEVIDIIACLSVENIFLNTVTEERKEAAEEARRELYRREGDHLTMLATVRAYASEHSDRKAWCEKFFVSHRGMQNVMDIRKQLTAQCRSLGFLSPSNQSTAADRDVMDQDALSAAILRTLLTGFAHNTARLMPDGTYRTLVSNQVVAIHPSSVLFGRKVEAIVFSEWVWTSKSFARGVSAVRLAWIEEVLVGGSATLD